jgi:putative FmdB family regulatory protein
MPTHAYQCPNGHKFEQFFRKISDAEAIALCPECGLPAERLISGGAGLVFKGSGFYITDYGKDGKKGQTAAPAGAGGAGTGEGGSGTERKSEGRSEEGRSGADSGSGSGKVESSPAPSGESISSGSTEAKPSPTTKPKPRSAKPE